MKNYYQISISGLNLHSIIAFFEHEKFQIQDLSKIGNKTIFVTLSKKQFKKFIATEFSKNYEIKIVKKFGNENLLQTFLKHFGLFLGTFVCFCFIFFSTNHIHSISFASENHVCENQDECIFCEKNKQKLEDVLETLGIKNGAKLPLQYSSREIERVLMENFKQISGVTIIQKGVNLEIQIQEAKLKESEHLLSLISPVSGIIITNNVISGESLVKNGDIVLEGQTLAIPKDDKKISATFEIRTFFHENLVYSETQTTYLKTGRTQTINSLEIFNKKIGKNETCKFNLFESQSKKRFAFFNLFLPFKTNSTIFFELEKKEQTVLFSDVEDELKQDLERKTKALIPSSAVQKNTTFSVFRENDKVRLDCYVECIIEVKA